VKHTSRSRRRALENLKKFGIWLFLLAFVLSLGVGVLITSVSIAK
jgi:hypothetical protein